MNVVARLLVSVTAFFCMFSTCVFAEPPKDTVSADQYRAKIGTLARELISPERGWIDQYMYDQQSPVGTRVLEGQIARKDHTQGDTNVRYLLFEPEQFVGSAILWLDGADKSMLYAREANSERIKPTALTQRLIDAGHAVVVIHLPRNRGPFPARVRTVLSAIGVGLPFATSLTIVGTGDAGPALLAASTFLEDLPVDQKRKIKEIIADGMDASFEKNLKPNDPFFLPKASDFGGILGLAALAAPLKLTVYGLEKNPDVELEPLKAMYRVTNAPKSLQLSPKLQNAEETVTRLSGKSL